MYIHDTKLMIASNRVSNLWVDIVNNTSIPNQPKFDAKKAEIILTCQLLQKQIENLDLMLSEETKKET
jgi:hypothetical protein